MWTILSLLFMRATRVQELVNLSVQDYDARSGLLQITDSKTDSGVRTIVLQGPAKVLMDHWIGFHRKAYGKGDRRTESDPLFYRIDRTGKIQIYWKSNDPVCLGPQVKGIPQGCNYDFQEGQRQMYTEKRYSKSMNRCPECGSARTFQIDKRAITTQAVRTMLNKRCKLAEIARLNTHDGRRTALTWLLEDDMLPAAQALAGHASKSQTLGYWRYSEKQYSEAYDALNQRQAEALGVEPNGKE